MKALSISQPWAWLIAQGFKEVENRRWPTAFRGQFLIHATSKWEDEQRADVARIRAAFPGIVLPRKFLLGGIVGHARLVDCVDRCDSHWFAGPYGFVIEDAEPLPFAPCRGELGFFHVSREILEACGIVPALLGAPAPEGI